MRTHTSIIHSMIIVVLAAVTSVPVTTTPGLAQQRQPPSSDSTTQGLATRPPAPVGHRQPKMSDLPPDLAKKEAGEAAAPTPPSRPDGIAPDPQICRGC